MPTTSWWKLLNANNFRNKDLRESNPIRNDHHVFLIISSEIPPSQIFVFRVYLHLKKHPSRRIVGILVTSKYAEWLIAKSLLYIPYFPFEGYIHHNFGSKICPCLCWKRKEWHFFYDCQRRSFHSDSHVYFPLRKCLECFPNLIPLVSEAWRLWISSLNSLARQMPTFPFVF